MSDDAAIQTTQTFSTETATAGMSASQAVANGDLSATTGTTGLNTAYTGTAGSSESLGVNASQADAQATQALTQAGGNAGGANAGPGLSGATKLQNPTTDTGGPEGATAPAPGTPGQTPPAADQQLDEVTPPGPGDYKAVPPSASGGGGYLSTALSDPKVQAAAVQGGLGMIGGLGSGMMQQSAMQKQIAAQQWGNAQWQDPNQVAQFEAAGGTAGNRSDGIPTACAADSQYDGRRGTDPGRRSGADVKCHGASGRRRTGAYVSNGSARRRDGGAHGPEPARRRYLICQCYSQPKRRPKRIKC